MNMHTNTLRGGTIYANTARFDNQARALTEDELHKLAPSIFAVEAHHSRSHRFRPIPTIEVVRGLAKEGFSVVGARQAVARQDDRFNYTKHLLRLRLGEEQKYSVGDTVFEMLLKNANDGTAAYDLMAGLFRICCLNSLVTQTDTLDSVKVRHSGDVTHKVIDATYSVVNQAETYLAAPQDWPQIKMERDERVALAKAVHVYRFADADGEVKTPITAEHLLVPRRVEDQESNLWNVFNVVQENTIKGGVTTMGRDALNRARRVTTRKINGIDQDIRLNKAMWVLAAEMAKLKQAA